MPGKQLVDSAGSGSAALSGRGYDVPPGSLDVWKAARANATNELVEIVIFGDSTTSGSCFDPPANSNSIYSWTQRLRARIASAGFLNGGRGVVSANEIAPGMNPDGITAISAITGFGSNDNNGPLLTDSLKSVAGGDSVTIQGKGTAIRLHYFKGSGAGGFTYAVDGGAAVTVEAGGSSFSGDSILVASGLADATHSIVITNLGGQLWTPPTIQLGSTGAFGSGANANMGDNPTTYDYVVTAVTAAGETVASASVTKQQGFTGGNRVSLSVAVTNNGAQSYNVYRRISGSGAYAFLANMAPTGGAGATTGFSTYVDTGAVAPNAGVNPPIVSTAGRNATNAVVQVVPAFFRATGVVVNKAGISGISSGSFFNPANPLLGNYPAQLLLGLTPGVPAGGQQYGWVQPEGAHPRFARCRLAIFALGINDMQGAYASGQTAITAAAATLRDNIAVFVRMARSAGADPLIVIPHYNIAQGNHNYAGEFFAASQSTAAAMSVPWVDFNEALGPASGWDAKGVAQTVHTSQAAYNLEADFLWDNVLSK